MKRNEFLLNAVQEHQCIYKSGKSHTDKVIISNIWKKVVEKIDVNVFSAVKVNQLHPLLFPHLVTLKIQSFLSKMLFNIQSIHHAKLTKDVNFKDIKHMWVIQKYFCGGGEETSLRSERK